MKKALLVLALALAGCASTRAVQSADPVPGHWVHVVDEATGP